MSDSMQVPGIPVGTKLVRVSKPNDRLQRGEYVIVGHSGAIRDLSSVPIISAGYAVITADNIYGVIDLEQVAIPAGWRRVERDWFRYPRGNNEWILNAAGVPSLADSSFSLSGDIRRIIVERDTTKTKRVLVIECDDEQLLAALRANGGIRICSGDTMANRFSIKFEERPL